MIYHVTIIGTQAKVGGPVRIERRISATNPQRAAQRALWEAESKGISASKALVKERQEEGEWGPHTIYTMEDLRPPLFGAGMSWQGASISADHLPMEERETATAMVNDGSMEGMVGYGRLAFRVAGIDIIAISDDLPILSTLVQVAQDERLDWLTLDVGGEALKDLPLYTNG